MVAMNGSHCHNTRHKSTTRLSYAAKINMRRLLFLNWEKLFMADSTALYIALALRQKPTPDGKKHRLSVRN